MYQLVVCRLCQLDEIRGKTCRYIEETNESIISVKHGGRLEPRWIFKKEVRDWFAIMDIPVAEIWGQESVSIASRPVAGNSLWLEFGDRRDAMLFKLTWM